MKKAKTIKMMQRERINPFELSNTNKPFILALSGPNKDLAVGQKRRDRLSELIVRADSDKEITRDELFELMAMHLDIIGFVKENYGRPQRNEEYQLILSGPVRQNEQGKDYFPGYAEIREKNPEFPELLRDKWERSYIFHMERVIEKYLYGLKFEPLIRIPLK